MYPVFNEGCFDGTFLYMVLKRHLLLVINVKNKKVVHALLHHDYLKKVRIVGLSNNIATETDSWKLEIYSGFVLSIEVVNREHIVVLLQAEIEGEMKNALVVCDRMNIFRFVSKLDLPYFNAGYKSCGIMQYHHQRSVAFYEQ
jgi:hypothetical protein